ncbi:MAG: lipopolysaccharide heptosyltransferase II [Pseudomonadales bacterium]|nr:lipopolysaccharide heptosyltransferase II [Pseudomonadales bacterium]
MKFSTEPRRILVVLPTWVGDVVMATPFLQAIHSRFQEAEISVLMYRHLHEVVAGSPWLGTAYYWPDKNVSGNEHRNWIKSLRTQEFDLAILLPNSLRVAWIAWRIRAKRRVGFARDARSWLLTDPLPVPNRRKNKFEPLPLVDYYDHFARQLGCSPPGDRLTLHTTIDQDNTTQARLSAEGVSTNGPIVTICPGAKFGASKCWHPERFAGVADELVRQHNATIVISPGPGEEPLAQAIADNMAEASVILAEPCLNLGELKSLVNQSALLLGNDTGPRHYARAFDTPRVTIFGPTEQRWTDTSHDKETIVKVEVPCGPCQKKLCPLQERICMDRITVEAVYAASAVYVKDYKK